MPNFLQKPLSTLQAATRQFFLNRTLIITMTVLQLLWLVVIVATGASTKYDTILVVAIFSVIATLVVSVLPVHVLPKLKDLNGWLSRNEIKPLIVLCFVALLIGLVYSFRPDYGGDEVSSLKSAQVIATEGVSAAYKRIGWLGGQHPPLFPLLFSLIFKLPGPDLILIRLVSVLFLAATLCVTYYLGRELYGREIGYLAAMLLLSFPLVTRLSASAIMDIPLTFFFGLTVLLLIRLSKSPSYGLSIAIGIIIGIGLLTKYIMILVFLVLFLYFLFLPGFRNILPQLFVITLVSFSIFGIWLLYASQMGVLNEQIQKIMNFTGIYHLARDLEETAQPVPPAATAEEAFDPDEQMQNGIFRLGLETIFTRLPSSLGLYHAPLILFGLLYLFTKRERADLTLLLWIGGVSIALLLTLPDHRYFLPVFPAIAIAMGRVLFRLPDYAERAVLLSLLFGVGNLYLFANWVREAHLFLLIP